MNKLLSIVIAIILAVGIAFGFVYPKSETPTVGFANQYDGFVVTKTFVASTISTTTPLDVTRPVSGALLVDNIVVSTDSTGFGASACTNIVVSQSGNTYGPTTLLSSATSTLGASASVDLTDAGTTKKRVVLENGAKLQISSTVAACTGSGVVKVTAFFKKAAANSSIADQ